MVLTHRYFLHIEATSRSPQFIPLSLSLSDTRMAEAIISPVVDLMLSHMVSIVGENISLILGFKKELGRLKDELQMIRAVLRDAERRMAINHEHEAVKLWLKRLEDFAYKAADVLDKFAYEALRRKVKKVNHLMPSSSESFISERKMGKRIKENFTSFLSKRKMAKKIKEIFASLDIINKQASDYGLQRVGGHVPRPPPRDRETDSFVNFSDVVGRETEISEIVNMLACQSDQQTLSILPIVGMGGIGKTTLAKLIYNDERIKGYLNKRIWVCVSSDFDVKRLLKEMLESLKKEKCHVDTMDAILEGLQNELSGDKYLLVLDDAWSEDHNKWDDFVGRLKSVNTTGHSKIVVTTRITKVASIVGTFESPYYIKGLLDDECWSIFSARAFANRGVLWSSDLEATGRQIVKKCSGLPLAAKVAGSMMRFKKDKHEWLSIANSRVWDSDGDESGVLPILKLSFDNLPSPSLKQCFSYCSIFIKDFNIDKKDLINLWMALGYLQPNEEDNVEMEDTGNMYFNILVQSSLFQDIRTDTFGNIIGCKMHDMVHDLAQYIAKHEVFTPESNTRLATNKIHQTRHLVSYCRGENFDNIQAEKLHTLFMSHMKDDISIVDFKCLRVLRLGFVGEKNFLTSISELMHLRYLVLPMWEKVVLPDSITNLYHLQTLRLGEVDCLPKDLSNLISLRHLYFNPSQKLKMPLNIGSLTCLRTLRTFIVGREKGRQIKELGSLENLGGRLTIRNLERVRSKDDARSANLSRKTKIDQLEFVWSEEREGDYNNDEDVIEGLQPHPNLKSLKVWNFAGCNFSVWMMNMAVNVGGSQLLLANLVEITLGRCYNVEGIPMLGQLPLLRHLRLSELTGMKYIGESFYGYNKGGVGVSSSSRKSYGVESSQPIILFPALKKLKFYWLESLEEWMGPNLEVFLCLEKLSVKGCRKLKTAPNHFPCLKKLEIEDLDSSLPVLNICSNLTTLTHLTINYVRELISLPDGLFHNNKQHLMELNIGFCPNLKSVPSLEGLKYLKTLRVYNCKMLESPPQGLQSCTSLDRLTLSDCDNVMVFFEDIRALPSLSYLQIHGLYPTLTSGLDRFQHPHCVSLRSLELWGRREWDKLPKQIQYLTALTSLQIRNFGVEALPDWFGNLESLEELELLYMDKLKYLPSAEAMQRLTKLRRLDIHRCPLLKARCEEGDRPEWSKISTIAEVVID